MLLTLYNFINRKKTLKLISQILKDSGAESNLINISLREKKLVPTPPPGLSSIVTKRDI